MRVISTPSSAITSVLPFAWEDATFFTPSTRRTTSLTCVSHIPQRIPSTSNVILSIHLIPSLCRFFTERAAGGKSVVVRCVVADESVLDHHAARGFHSLLPGAHPFAVAPIVRAEQP